jgi:hypothetical protein
MLTVVQRISGGPSLTHIHEKSPVRFLRSVSPPPIAGSFSGCMLVGGIWLGRKAEWKRNKVGFVIAGTLLLSVGSALAFTFGCMYIAEIWFEGSDIYVGSYSLAAFFGWLWTCLAVNFAYYRLMRRKRNQEVKPGCKAGMSSKPCEDDGMKETNGRDGDDGVGFEAVDGTMMQGAATGDGAVVETSTVVITSCSEDLELTLKRSSTSETETSDCTSPCSISISLEGDLSILETSGRQDKDDSTNNSCLQSDDSVSGNDMDDPLTLLDDYDDLKTNGCLSSPLWFCCDRDRQHERRVARLLPPRPPKRGPTERIAILVKWVLWGVASAFHLYLTIVNIGATKQQSAVRVALPATFALLYPPDYTAGGPMCAWNESSPDAEIRSFENFDAVQAANFSVVHCGGCGACSNWNDLRLQWTTRTFLAAEAQKW